MRCCHTEGPRLKERATVENFKEPVRVHIRCSFVAVPTISYCRQWVLYFPPLWLSHHFFFFLLFNTVTSVNHTYFQVKVIRESAWGELEI